MLTAEARIRRLRLRLTALFTLTSAVGLVGLTAFAVHSDTTARSRQLDTELRMLGSTAVTQLGYDEQDQLFVHDLLDTTDTNCPQLTVLERTSGRYTVAHAPRTPCIRATDADIHDLAVRAATTNATVEEERRAQDGRPVRLLVRPFPGPDGETPGGAVVVAASTATDPAQHQLRVLLITGSLVLVSLSAVAGHLLAGRAIRPALATLRLQEQFLADAAHDLRTPAATLRALAATALRETGLRETALREPGLREPARPGDAQPQDTVRTSALQRTERLAARMGDLVDGLLTRARLVAGISAPVREPLRLDQLVEAVVDDTDTGGHRVTVRTEPAVVTADPDLLRRAVANLLGNALAYGHAPGAPADIHLRVTGDGVVTVDDSGPGVPPELAGSLFERFRSGSGSSGLGLSITSWVAHAHDGSLTVGTSPTGGARFTLRLGAGSRPPGPLGRRDPH
ncbi:sensor histidine kinase [Kitasatospora sp. NPDC059088]|uniref:sensor histidine kinase n=1 Tax=Kitasatospora sp. NPDC059088 TaxID=3346722 RepID=UPI0036B2A1FF